MAHEGAALRQLGDDSAERLRIEAAQADPRRFAELYEEHFERVYAFIARRVHHREETQDLTAEVFKRALQGLPRYEWRGTPFSAWLFRIAANAIASRGQRSGREAQMPAVPSADASGMEEIEERARAFRLVGELPDDQRRVILMRFVQQQSIREIAAALARSEGAVKQLQFRALQNLRARLGETDV